MDSSTKNERRDSSCLKRSSDDDISFSDWHFVDRSEEQGSDDDSIEVIEREVLGSSPSHSESEESENEEYFKDFTNDANEADFTENDIRTIVPLNRCHSCSLPVKNANRREIFSYRVALKVLHFFMMGVLANLVFHNCKSFIPNRIVSFPLDNAWNTADGVYSFLFPFASTNFFSKKYGLSMFSNPPEKNDDFLARMTNTFEEHKMIFDNTLMKQFDLLKHVQQLKNDVYFFEISRLAPLIREEDIIEHLNMKKQVLPCEDNVTDELLPLVCKNGPASFVFVRQSQITSIHDSILQFFDNTERRANSLRQSILTSLTEPFPSEKITRENDGNNFAHDCDHFSKRYKSNAHCSRNAYEDDAEVSTEQTQSVFDERTDFIGSQSSKTVLAADNELIHSKTEPVGMKICRMCQSLAVFMENELKKKVGKESEKPSIEVETLMKACRTCESIESPVPTGSSNVDEEEKGGVDENESTKVVGSEGKEPISGEWLFDLHNARAKLRDYYSNIVSGDWLLKLGRARDRLRNNRSKHHRGNEDSEKSEKVRREYQGQHWYKKNIEKFKSKFKTLIGEMKHQFKVAKEGIASKFKVTKERIASKLKELKSEFKDRFRK